MKASSILIVILAMVILSAMIDKPNAAMCAIAPVVTLFYLAFWRPHRCDGFSSVLEPEIMGTHGLADESTPDPALNVCAERSPPDAWHPETRPSVVSPEQLAAIAKENACALNELYGRRSNGSIDSALYVHKQRIGDRDRQATINQVKGRRNNVYEPYYRQELSERNSERWWEADNLLVRSADKRWLDTVPMNRDLLRDENVDGIYGRF